MWSILISQIFLPKHNDFTKSLRKHLPFRVILSSHRSKLLENTFDVVVNVLLSAEYCYHAFVILKNRKNWVFWVLQIFVNWGHTHIHITFSRVVQTRHLCERSKHAVASNSGQQQWTRRIALSAAVYSTCLSSSELYCWKDCHCRLSIALKPTLY